MEKEKFSISNLTNSDGCFDLQFRKDTRHERSGSPTYYRWKAQFIITVPKEHMAILQKVKKIMSCGLVSIDKGQARFSVQKIDDIIQTIIPYFTRHSLGVGGLTKNRLSGNPPSHKASAGQSKKRDFDLWQKAVEIIYRNKGVYISKWKKNDLLHLMEIHKSMAKYKQKPKKSKWMDMAQAMSKTK